MTDEAIHQAIVSATVAFVFSIGLTPLVREVARYRALLDRPNTRSSHEIAVPRFGGIAVMIGALVGSALTVIQTGTDFLGILAAALIVGAVGVVDDFRSLSVPVKYLSHVVGGAVGALAIRPTFDVDLGLVAFGVSGIAGIVFGAVFLVVMVNAINFIDGIDGLASGVTMVLVAGAVMLNSGSDYQILLPLVAAIAGFMTWNFQPASIFLGDGGAYFLGMILGTGLIYRPGGDVPLVPVILCVSPVLVDTGFTIVRRAFRGANIFKAHREHLFQRLVSVGYVHRSVSSLYYLLCALALLVAYGYETGGPADKVILLAASIAAGVGYILAVFAIEKGVLQLTIVMPSSIRNRSAIGRGGQRPGQSDTIEA